MQNEKLKKNIKLGVAFASLLVVKYAFWTCIYEKFKNQH